MLHTDVTLVFGMSKVNSSTNEFAGLVTISSGVPICVTSPSLIIAIRSPTVIASSRSWVINTMVFWIVCCNFFNSILICLLINGSRPLKGSSMRRISGSTARARAIPTLCCIPPLNSEGYDDSHPDRPTKSKTSCALAFRVSLSIFWISSPYPAFSNTVL